MLINVILTAPTSFLLCPKTLTISNTAKICLAYSTGPIQMFVDYGVRTCDRQRNRHEPEQVTVTPNVASL